MITGNARLLPEVATDWLVDEAGDAFLRGDVFITPEPLVGISGERDRRTSFESLLESLSVEPGRLGELFLSVDLPGLDGMSSTDFERLLKESTVELERLRMAARRLVDAMPDASIESLVAEINYEVSELVLAEKYNAFRTNVTRLGGVLGVTAAAIGSAVGATSGFAPGTAAAAAGGAAAAGLVEYLRQAAEHGLEMRRNPYYLLWELGQGKAVRSRGARRVGRHPSQRRVKASKEGHEGCHHWLSPPTAGVGFLGIEKDPS